MSNKHHNVDVQIVVCMLALVVVKDSFCKSSVVGERDFCAVGGSGWFSDHWNEVSDIKVTWRDTKKYEFSSSSRRMPTLTRLYCGTIHNKFTVTYSAVFDEVFCDSMIRYLLHTKTEEAIFSPERSAPSRSLSHFFGNLRKIFHWKTRIAKRSKNPKEKDAIQVVLDCCVCRLVAVFTINCPWTRY